MRDTLPTHSAQALTPAPHDTSASPLQSLRHELIQALQTSLDPNTLVELFYRHSKAMVDYHGLRFSGPEQRQPTDLGHHANHQCHYRLRLPDSDLGEMTFYRRRRFSEQEQQTLESLLGTLAFPLRNALQYQTVLKQSLVDPLTQLGNRTALNNTLERERQQLLRKKEPFALVLLDIDHFKAINDQYGHVCGDEVIKAIAATIEQISRGTDMAFRYGGEEFALLLSNTGAAGALVTAERLRRAIAGLLLNDHKETIRPNVSLGVSACLDANETATSLIERADRALYQAKAGGRNRTCCEPPMAEVPSHLNVAHNRH
jgi:diguanylate cyclase (GGDEF)-like protein